MKATEYIRKHEQELLFTDRIKRVIADLRPFRLDEKATQQYFFQYLYPEYSYQQFKCEAHPDKSGLAFRPKEKELELYEAIPFRTKLMEVVKNDDSYGYLYCNLAWLLNTSDRYYIKQPLDSIPDKNKIEQAIIPVKDINYFLGFENKQISLVYILIYQHLKNLLDEISILIFFNALEYIRINNEINPLECLDLTETDFPLNGQYQELFTFCVLNIIDGTSKLHALMDKDKYLFEDSIYKSLFSGIPREEAKEEIKFDYEITRMTRIYDFCNNDVFKNTSIGEFLSCVEKADFKLIYNKKGTIKNKLKRMISIIQYRTIDSKQASEWYRKTANSIGSTPEDCSGASVPSEWKNNAEEFKKKFFTSD